MYHNVNYNIFLETKLLDSNGFPICTYNNWTECVGVGTLYFVLIVAASFGIWLIWNILTTCKKDITESFEYAQSLTDVHVDKLNKAVEKKVY